MNHHRRWVELAALLAALVLTGCSGGAPSSGIPSATPLTNALPPRPAVLVLAGVDACALLTDPQRQQLGVNRGSGGKNADDPDRPACDWSNFPNIPDNGWEARIVTRYGAEYALRSQTGSQLVTVDGFPTIQTASPDVEFNNNCVLYIDVAPGQTLETFYTNGRGDYPGITHEVACQQASKAAELMVDTLRTLKG